MQAAQVRKNGYVPEPDVKYQPDLHNYCSMYAGTMVQQVPSCTACLVCTSVYGPPDAASQEHNTLLYALHSECTHKQHRHRATLFLLPETIFCVITVESLVMCTSWPSDAGTRCGKGVFMACS